MLYSDEEDDHQWRPQQVVRPCLRPPSPCPRPPSPVFPPPPAPHELAAPSSPKARVVARVVWGGGAGVLCGCLVWTSLYYQLLYSWVVSVTIALGAAILIALVVAVCRVLRAAVTVCLPSVCTTRGRIFGLCLASGLLGHGPVMNMYVNVREMSRSLTCHAQQSYNQSVLLLRPFDSMMERVEQTLGTLQTTAAGVRNALDPLDTRLTNLRWNLGQGRQELEGARGVCELMVRGAQRRCEDGISSARKQCLEVVTALGTVYVQAKDVLDQINPERWAPRQQHLYRRQIIGAATKRPDEDEEESEDDDVCEPLDVDKMCGSLNDTRDICQPTDWAGSAIGAAVNATYFTLQTLKHHLSFDVAPDPYYFSRVNRSREVYETRLGAVAVFDRSTGYLEFTLTVLVRLVPLSVLLLLHASYTHVINWLTNDDYDNVYVCERMRVLDSRHAGRTLLPLRPHEANYVVDLGRRLGALEAGLWKAGLCVYVLHVSLAGVCWGLAGALYWVLQLQDPVHDPDTTGQRALGDVVSGEGVIVTLLQTFLSDLHPAQHIGFEGGVNRCLPRPTPPSPRLFVVQLMMYLTLLLTVLFKAHLLRLRQRLLSCLYPERQRARTVHLYNLLLAQRAADRPALRVLTNHRQRVIRNNIDICARCRRATCLLCEGRVSVRCYQPCDATYCHVCYNITLHAVCPICRVNKSLPSRV